MYLKIINFVFNIFIMEKQILTAEEIKKLKNSREKQVKSQQIVKK